MELSDRYVMKSLCRRAAMATSRREAARSAVGAFTRLWLRSWRERGRLFCLCLSIAHYDLSLYVFDLDLDAKLIINLANS